MSRPDDPVRPAPDERREPGLRVASVSKLASIVANSRRRGIGFEEWIDRCLERSPFALDRPFYDQEAVERASRELFSRERELRFFVLRFQIGCEENPFLTYADEPAIDLVLRLEPQRLAVDLVDEEQEVLGGESVQLEADWTLDDLADAFGRLVESPRITGPVARYLRRWALLVTGEDELAAGFREIAAALDHEGWLEVEPSDRPWRAWLRALADDDSLRGLARSLADLGSPDVDARTLANLIQLVERCEDRVRLAIEVSLLCAFACADRPGPVLSPTRLERAGRYLRALVAPDERLPGVLEARVRLILDRILRPAALSAPGTGGPEEPRGFSPEDRTADLAARQGWNDEERTVVVEAFEETETVLRASTFDWLEHLIGKYDVTARHVACVLHVRRWCESEGYGRRYKDLDPDTRLFAPPTFEAIFRFVAHFPDVPDPEEAIATLDEWIQRRFVDPREFENDLFRHLRLIAFTERG